MTNLLIRMTDEQHRTLREAASHQGTSLNAFIVNAALGASQRDERIRAITADVIAAHADTLAALEHL